VLAIPFVYFIYFCLIVGFRQQTFLQVTELVLLTYLMRHFGFSRPLIFISCLPGCDTSLHDVTIWKTWLHCHENPEHSYLSVGYYPQISYSVWNTWITICLAVLALTIYVLIDYLMRSILSVFSSSSCLEYQYTSTHLHLEPRSKNEWSYTSTPPIRLHGVVLS
jgi:hypothetical protein